jgi:hypothetical protein
MTGGKPYTPLVRRLFWERPGAGRPSGPGWVCGEAREPLSATHVRLWLRGSRQRLEEARFEVRGCPHTVAALACFVAELPGQSVVTVDVDPIRLSDRVGAPAEKRGRLLLIQDAWRQVALLLPSALP